MGTFVLFESFLTIEKLLAVVEWALEKHFYQSIIYYCLNNATHSFQQK